MNERILHFSIIITETWFLHTKYSFRQLRTNLINSKQNSWTFEYNINLLPYPAEGVQ